MADQAPLRRNLAALVGSIFAAAAAAVVAVTIVLALAGTRGISESTYARFALTLAATIVLLSTVALVMGIIGLRRSARLGRRGLAVATVVVGSAFLGFFALEVLVGVIGAAMTGGI
jgi:heme/copper-type cytochrome/quinol oxidase subunit 3